MRFPSSLVVLCAAVGVMKVAAQTGSPQLRPGDGVTAVPVTSVTAVQAVATAAGAAGNTVNTSGPVTVIVAQPATSTTGGITAAMPIANLRLTNLSTRARVTSEQPLMTGFAIAGDTSRTVLVRAAGPALGNFGLAGAASALRLRLHDGEGKVIAESGAWNNAPDVAIATAYSGAFPFANGSADVALVMTLPAGKYSAEVMAEKGGDGVALVEVYDVFSTTAGSKLTNVSTLGTVAPAGGELISGFVIDGTGSKQFLVRGVGPALAKFSVGGALSDPNLTVFDSVGTPLATNNDWSSGVPINPASATAAGSISTVATAATVASSTATLSAAMTRAGAFGLDGGSADAAMLVTLFPGAYTVQVNAAAGSAASGKALLEIYQLP